MIHTMSNPNKTSENPVTTSRGATSEQSQIATMERRQDEMMDQIVRLTQALQRMAVQPRQRERRDYDDEEYDEEGSGVIDDVEEPVPRRQQKRHTPNIKMRIPTFKGTSDPEEYLDWVQRVEKVFDCQEYTELQKCKYAALEFTDYAVLWWDKLIAQRRIDEEGEIRSWRTMKNLMKKRFVPEYYKQDLYIRM